ncbi:hypothetical protein O7632_06985 [Solwaraspora sp. WMMD406]|uniref:hypothetical protein n=1 Tax=Solwaraspora sp. WMMD406 TaxID=3016095 RepID=UPI002417A04A|nr:hypothetical protein [Solwaraspora sp. WMMD406]MDG4763852.1 hypothetical protein [Solwaraspora sp. WMMD406]
MPSSTADAGGPVSSRHNSIGLISVYGFFVLSGFLITGSGLRFGVTAPAAAIPAPRTGDTSELPTATTATVRSG